MDKDLAGVVIGCAIEVHRQLGPGLLESVYQKCLVYELRNLGIQVEYEVKLPVLYKGIEFDNGFRIDLLVSKLLIVELKTVKKLENIHQAQLLTYMKLANIGIGLLINFNEVLLKNGIKRMVL
ncbi:GxxExxY protein [Psychrosphaera aquimarina]|jgi:GxxExxY protein|uniref:GxxExxY protein n=1 Tax=Psychrosphaera aquimarina TaxID=2044854 RepID=A0ABU3R0H3_9GAMM|nr:GxxExxY protein [Psychrosphaera aquimarina]MDU0112962.1 GxxExxY protein [Psychrosphaera aquimarina]